MKDRTLPRADALPVSPRATVTFRLLKATLGPLLGLVFRFRLLSAERIPRTGPYIVISNHLNWIDAWTLLLLFPTEPRMHFLANPANLMAHPLHWWVVRHVGGYIPVDVKHEAGEELFKHVDLCLQRGGVVAIFPEADYGPREGELQPLKKGFAHFAVDNQVPVLPVALSGTKELWLGKRITLTVGEPEQPPAPEAIDAFFELGRERLGELLPPYRDPGGRKPLKRLLTRLLY